MAKKWNQRPWKNNPISENDELLLSDSEEGWIIKRIKAIFFKWPKWDKGEQGDKWDKGDKGDQGDKWDTWLQWPQWVK